MMRTAPHPDAALLFLDFILTDGQKVFMSEGALSTNRMIEEPPKGLDLIFVDNAKVLDEGDKWTKIYRDIFVANAR
jgi:iron(III) transport system substrate-binding protein